MKNRIRYIVQACNTSGVKNPAWELFTDIHGDSYEKLEEAQENLQALKKFESEIVKYRLIKRTEEVIE